MACRETGTFEKIQMPLVHILDFFCFKLSHKRVANTEFHDAVYSMFKSINCHYDKLFEKTCHLDKGWCEMMEYGKNLDKTD